MTTRLLFVLTILLSAVIQCFVAQPQARAGDMSCSGLIGGGRALTNINGNVTVPDGKSCTLSFVNIKGDVRVGRDATLVVSAYTEPSEIGGDIEAKNCKSVLLQGNVTVGGNLNISSCSGTASKNGFQGPDVLMLWFRLRRKGFGFSWHFQASLSIVGGIGFSYPLQIPLHRSMRAPSVEAPQMSQRLCCRAVNNRIRRSNTKAKITATIVQRSNARPPSASNYPELAGSIGQLQRRSLGFTIELVPAGVAGLLADHDTVARSAEQLDKSGLKGGDIRHRKAACVPKKQAPFSPISSCADTHRCDSGRSR